MRAGYRCRCRSRGSRHGASALPRTRLSPAYGVLAACSQIPDDLASRVDPRRGRAGAAAPDGELLPRASGAASSWSDGVVRMPESSRARAAPQLCGADPGTRRAGRRRDQRAARSGRHQIADLRNRSGGASACAGCQGTCPQGASGWRSSARSVARNSYFPGSASRKRRRGPPAARRARAGDSDFGLSAPRAGRPRRAVLKAAEENRFLRRVFV